MATDVTTLVKNHLITLRNANAGRDATTLFIKDIPTVRAGVTVPDCDLTTELAVYITANG